jgi:hypothetical protein
MTKQEEYESIETKVSAGTKETGTGPTSSFSVQQQFMLAFLFSLPSTFREAIRKNTSLNSPADLDKAMRDQVKHITGKPVQDGDFRFPFLWNPTTRNADTSDPVKVSKAFIFGYTTPPCPNAAQQNEIVRALLNAPIPGSCS